MWGPEDESIDVSIFDPIDKWGGNLHINLIYINKKT